MKWCLGAFKIVSFVLVILVFISVGSLIQLALARSPRRTRALALWTSWICRFCLWGARVKVLTEGYPSVPQDIPLLVVANHMGMLDILILAKHLPAVFVTSYELKETPVVGWLTQAGGCVFVERRNRQNIHNEVRNISSTLKAGTRVVVFPEATSTNGDYVHPFKKSLFVSAVETPALVLPVTINYLTADHKKVTRQNRDQVCWYGDQSFHGALWRLMCTATVKVEMIFHPTFRMHTADDRHEISRLSHQVVQSRFNSLNQDP